MTVYFTLSEMTQMRYLYPLAEEVTNRGLQSVFLPFERGKYNCVGNHKATLEKLCQNIDAKIAWLPHWRQKKEDCNFKNEGELIFCVEGAKGAGEKLASGFLPRNNRFVSLVYAIDYLYNYHVYKDLSEAAVFTSQDSLECVYPPLKRAASTYEASNTKNIALGSPKFDVKLDANKIREKYNLSSKPKALFIFPPDLRGLYTNDHKLGFSNEQFSQLYSTLNDLGLEVLVKNRAKNINLNKALQGDRYFLDTDWHPHTTMELMEVADLIINVDSSAIDEAIMAQKPILNFNFYNPDIGVKAFPYLYKYDYCIEFKEFPPQKKLKEACSFLINTDFTNIFNESIKKHMCEKFMSSKKIIDHFL